MNWLLFVVAIIITITIHELGHLLAALYCKLGIEYVSIGFGKPFITFKFKGINFRLTPWILGGEVRLKGEMVKCKDGFLSLPYKKKVLISLAGVFMNLVLALVLYLFLYQSVITGIKIDYTLLKACCTKHYVDILPYLHTILRVPQLLIFLTTLNITAFAINSIPFPALDGGMVAFVWLEKIYPKNFDKILAKIFTLGFIFLMYLQVLIVIYLW